MRLFSGSLKILQNKLNKLNKSTWQKPPKSFTNAPNAVELPPNGLANAPIVVNGTRLPKT